MHVLRSGVSDGTRTRDIRDHNATLYQLSYTHHGGQEGLRATLAGSNGNHSHPPIPD